ncbi:MAG: ankyrin repeat domain-containing protein [Gammaproteobacteria bacterium]|nr:ankyrin repeat domain-containing protein [Gammaproteobacteria bacterium]
MTSNEEDLETAVMNGNIFYVLIASCRIDLSAIDAPPVLLWATNSRLPWPMVRLLLLRGANINAHDQDGHTALMEAVALVAPTYVKLFLRYGADPNKQNRGGASPLMLIGDDGTDEPIRIAEMLLKHGADPSIRAVNGMTALQNAKRLQNRALAEFLISHGASE